MKLIQWIIYFSVLQAIFVYCGASGAGLVVGGILAVCVRSTLRPKTSGSENAVLAPGSQSNKNSVL